MQTFGEGPACDWIASGIEIADDQTRFVVQSGSGEDEAPAAFEIPVPGKHNALNALAAIAVGRRFGLNGEQIAQGLRSVKLTGMRIERSRAACGAVHVERRLQCQPDIRPRGHCARWRICAGTGTSVSCSGDMLELGPQEAEMHAEIGRLLSTGIADYVYAYGPLSAHLAEAAKPAFPDGGVRHFTEKQQLAATLLRETEPDDLVLFKASRGMKIEEIVDALQRGGVG